MLDEKNIMEIICWFNNEIFIVINEFHKNLKYLAKCKIYAIKLIFN